MCCGQKRTALRSTMMPPAPPTPRLEGSSGFETPVSSVQAPPAAPVAHQTVNLHYLKNWPARVRGQVTGAVYEFSRSQPVRAVDPRDAAALLRTRFFRQI